MTNKQLSIFSSIIDIAVGLLLCIDAPMPILGGTLILSGLIRYADTYIKSHKKPRRRNKKLTNIAKYLKLNSGE